MGRVLTMKEYTTPLGRKIYVFENAFPKEVCESLMKHFPKGNYTGKIVESKTVPNELLELYKTYCRDSPIEIVSADTRYTIGASYEPIWLHTDNYYESADKWKIFVYLNDVKNGGTIFREGGKDILIKNGQGSVVLFDIKIPHLGQFSNSRVPKYTIGFRPITNMKH